MIRKATKDDTLQLFVLCKEFSKEAPPEYKMDPKKVQRVIEASFETPAMEIFVAEEDNEIVGFLVAFLSVTMFSDDIVASELAWFVSKEHRNARTAFKLLDSLEDWGKAMGAKSIVMADIQGLQSLSPLYKRRGYSMAEVTYRKPV
jgi:GNAT superfamily N-acetyltransferase